MARDSKHVKPSKLGIGRVLKAGLMVFPLALAAPGCVIEHLTETSGTYHEIMAQKQVQIRMSQDEGPEPMSAETAAIVMDNYKSVITKSSLGGNQGSGISLLPLQR